MPLVSHISPTKFNSAQGTKSILSYRPWLPSDITSGTVRRWWNANDGVNYTGGNRDITSWVDKMEGGILLPSATPPTHWNGSTFGGGVYFATRGRYMYENIGFSFFPDGNLFMAMVSRPTYPSTNQTAVALTLSRSDILNNSLFLHNRHRDGVWKSEFAKYTTQPAYNYIGIEQPQPWLEQNFSMMESTDGENLFYSQNGGDWNFIDFNGGTVNEDGFDYIGVNCLTRLNVVAQATYYQGYVYDIVIVQLPSNDAGSMSDDDRQRLEGYFAHTWDLTAKLPVDHPYKTAAPLFTLTPNNPVVSIGTVQDFNVGQGTKQSSFERDWTPSDLTVTPELWLKGDEGLNYNGSNEITSWEDQSGNGKDAVVGSLSPPFLNTFASQNAIPSVYFRSGTPTLLTHPEVLSKTAAQEYTAFYMTAFKEVPTAPLSYIHTGDNLNDDYTLGFFTDYAAGNASFGIARAAPINEKYWVGTNPPAPPEDTWQILSFQNSKIYADGVDQPVRQSNTGNAYGGGLTTLGTRLDITTFYMGGALGEVIIFGYTLNQTEREKVEGYLAHRWGTEGELPDEHPYKSAAPTVEVESSGDFNIAQGTKIGFNSSIVTPSIPSITPPWYADLVDDDDVLMLWEKEAGYAKGSEETDVPAFNYYEPVGYGYGVVEEYHSWSDYNTFLRVRDELETKNEVILGTFLQNTDQYQLWAASSSQYASFYPFLTPDLLGTNVVVGAHYKYGSASDFSLWHNEDYMESGAHSGNQVIEYAYGNQRLTALGANPHVEVNVLDNIRFTSKFAFFAVNKTRAQWQAIMERAWAEYGT